VRAGEISDVNRLYLKESVVFGLGVWFHFDTDDVLDDLTVVTGANSCC